MENLAWASVQINGYCKTQEFKVALANQSQTLPKTSLNIHENSHLSTSPKILFCDLRLANGESRTCKLTVFRNVVLIELSCRLLSRRNPVVSTNIPRSRHQILLQSQHSDATSRIESSIATVAHSSSSIIDWREARTTAGSLRCHQRWTHAYESIPGKRSKSSFEGGDCLGKLAKYNGSP